MQVIIVIPDNVVPQFLDHHGYNPVDKVKKEEFVKDVILGWVGGCIHQNNLKARLDQIVNISDHSKIIADLKKKNKK